MTRIMRLLPLSLFLLSSPALANDGIGGLSATGLTFGQTDAVQMAEEDLFISAQRIKVAYLFRNISDQDVTGEVIFPLPPISLFSVTDGMVNLPEDVSRDNLVNFTALVDGKAVEVGIDRVAVIAPDGGGEAEPPLSVQYDTPGTDVTALLQAKSIPITLDTAAVEAALAALPEAGRRELAAANIVMLEETADPAVSGAYPLWSVVLRYHWTQVFAAGKDLRIEHAYENYPPSAIFGWSPDEAKDARTNPDSYSAATARTYCIDEGTSRAMTAALTSQYEGETQYYGSATYLDYVLRTANSWAGPIGKFRLTLDKGAPGNVISLCVDGIKKTGPTSFVVEKTDFVPEADLRILLVQGMTD